jgi:hypothetical protein
MVHVTTSQRSHKSETEDGRSDSVGCDAVDVG